MVPSVSSGLRRKAVWCLIALVALACAYMLAGFYLVPHLIRSQATSWVRTNLGKPLALGEIRFNPFSFTLDVRDVAIGEPARPMVAIGHLRLDFSILSLFQNAYCLDEVRIDRPFIHAIVRPDDSLNLIELMPRTPSRGPNPAIRIGSLSVDQGRIAYVDLSRPLKPEKTLAPIGFTLKDFQTNRAKGGAFTLHAKSERGEGLAWTGTVSMAPIASQGRFDIAGLRSETVQKFLSGDLPIILTHGEATLHGNYRFAYGTGGARLSAEVPRLTVSGLTFNGKPDLFRGTVKLDRAEASIGRIAWASGGDTGMELEATVPRMALHAVNISATGAARDEAITLADVKLEDSRLNYGARTFDLGRLAVNGADLPVRRERDGRINWTKLMPAPSHPDHAPPAQTSSWQIRLGRLALDEATLRVEDRAVTPVGRFVLHPVTLSATDATNDFSKPMNLRFEARIGGKTDIKGDGTIVPATYAANLKLTLTPLPLRTILPYLPHYPGLELRSGTVSASGALQSRGAGIANLRFQGSAAIDDFAIYESVTNNPLFAWQGFALTGIDYRSGHVDIDRARLTQPLGRVEILPNGTFNYTSLTSASAASAQSAGPVSTSTGKAEAPAPPPVHAMARSEPPALPVRMKQLDITGGTMSFADYSIQPNFEARIDALHGRLTNLSNMPGTITTIDLSGQIIDRFSPATIKGTMDLLSYDRHTDMHLAFRNIELPVFNPYSGRYAGYAIAKGKLTTELSYKIENRALKADHHIIIDQLKWGQATESKQKVPLPIRLATSLLKNKDGVIDLDVPVAGSLDDPKFRLAPIVWKIIGNVIEKAVTAPFRLIGSIFAGAEKAQYVDFAPGSAALPSGSAESFGALAKALAKRSELQLDIPAGPAIKEDAIAIADARIDALLMAKESRKEVAADPAALKTDERYDRLKALYKARLGKKPVFPDMLAGEPSKGTKRTEGNAAKLKDSERRKIEEAEWMRSRLRATFLPSNAELAKLGSARAIAIRDALLASGAIDPVRIFMATELSATATGDNSRLELKLKVSVRRDPLCPGGE